MNKTCPACGKSNIINVSARLAGKRIAFTCKGQDCEQRLEVNIPSHATPEQNSRQTVIIPTSQVSYIGGTLSIVVNGEKKEYPLRTGTNIVGRQSASSPADISLPVDDKYMSRMHVVITVGMLGSGQYFSLKDYNSKNSTSLNSIALKKGEEIYLVDGDRIKMGETIVTFQKS